MILFQPFKRQPHKMVKPTQTIRRLLPTNCLSVFDDFVELVLQGLKARMKHVNHPSNKAIRDRFPNNRFSFDKVTKSEYFTI